MNPKFQLKPLLDAANHVPTTRNVRCQSCGGKLYYIGQAEYKPEYFILVKTSIHGPNVDGFYVHQQCWKEKILNSSNFESENSL